MAVVLAGLWAAHCIADDNTNQPLPSPESAELAAELGVQFVNGSPTKIILEREGTEYEIDLATQQIRPLLQPAAAQSVTENQQPAGDASNSTTKAAKDANAIPRIYYRPGDDFIFTLPSGRPIDKHTWSINFTHRFPYEAAFTGAARGATLLGLDDFAVPSFGFQYGVTSHLSVSVYRSPSIIGRPIEMGVRYNFLSERHGPFNAAVRYSIDGQDNFSRNFTSNFELQASRSLGSHAQVYAIPTLSLHNRPVIAAQSSLIDALPYQPCGQLLANGVPTSFGVHPCANTFSIGVGLAVDVRPSVALVGEVIPTAVNGTDLGIHRMPFSFGIQKKIYHHAFTFGFTTAPGTTTSQRIGTRSLFLLDPHSDTPGGMFVGFDLLRQIP